MHVAVLVTGGKDSVLALHRISKAEYDIKYMVSMIPLKEDSWMFHYPNINLVTHIAKAVEIPLIKAETSGEKEVEVEASTLKEALRRLISKYGKDFRERIYDETGNPRRFINIYVNGKDIRFLNRLETTLNHGDNISIMPAVSGG